MVSSLSPMRSADRVAADAPTSTADRAGRAVALFQAPLKLSPPSLPGKHRSTKRQPSSDRLPTRVRTGHHMTRPDAGNRRGLPSQPGPERRRHRLGPRHPSPLTNSSPVNGPTRAAWAGAMQRRIYWIATRRSFMSVSSDVDTTRVARWRNAVDKSMESWRRRVDSADRTEIPSME